MRLIKRRSSSNLTAYQNQASSSSSTTSLANPTPDIPVPPIPALYSSTTDDAISPTKGVKGKKKRDSQEMKYPPTSFGQGGAGWSFGRMRSFKGKSKAGQDPSISGSEDEGNELINRKGKGKQASTDNLEVSSQSALPSPLSPLAPSAYPIPLNPAELPHSPPPPQAKQTHLQDPLKTLDFSSAPSSSASQRPYPQPSQLITAFIPNEQQPAPVTVLTATQSEASTPLLFRQSSLVATPSANSPQPSLESRDSCPLIPRNDSAQVQRRVTTGPNSPRKLTKRRPVSIIYDQVELLERPSVSSNPEPRDFGIIHSQNIPLLPCNVLGGPSVHPSSTLPLPEGAAPPHHQQHNWPLNRNPSCSTNASSGMTPSTDESGTLETPNTAYIVPGQGEDRLWDRIGEPRPTLSRSSTFSFQEGDDESITKRESYFFHHKVRLDDNLTRQRSKRNLKQASNSSSGLRGDESPTFPSNSSNVTYTPTVSSGSDVTARLPRNLRISTSNLELKTSGKNKNVVSPTTPSSKKAIACDVKPTKSEDNGELVQDERPVPTRPPLNRLRSSSLGAMSINTNSVYSVGEIVTATNAIVATPRAVTINRSTTKEPVRMNGELAEILAGFENSSDAIRRAFDNERERGDWPLSASPEKMDAMKRPPATLPMRFQTSRPAPPPPRLAYRTEKTARPPLSPILRSASSVTSPKKLVSFNSNTTVESDELPHSSPKRPTMPARSSSLGRLWRRLSSSGSGIKTSKSKSSFTDLDDDIPPVPQAKKTDWYGTLTESSTKAVTNSQEQVMSTRMKRSKGSLDLTSAGKENPDFTPALSKSGFVKDINRTPTSSSGGSKRSKEKKRMSSIPPPRARSVPLPIRSDTPPIIPPLAPTPPLNDQLPTPTELGLHSTEPVPAEISAVSEALTFDVPVRSFRKLSAPPSSTWKTPLGPYTPPLSAIVSDYFRDLKSTTSAESTASLFTREVTLHRASLHEDSEYQSYDAKRRYRQSLVEIKDDQAFQATVEELVKLESDGRVRMTRAGGAALRNDQMPLLFRTPSKDLTEKHARQENIRAWFVTRELVQGERRHGRLLAKGVAAVQLVAQSSKDIPPVPPIPTSDTSEHALTSPRPPRSSGHSRSGSGNIKTPSILRRSRTSTAPNTPNSSSLALNTLGSPLSRSPSNITQSPIEILLLRLPKLYALSLALSERFEHDPSPYGVADAFISMEDFLIKEISEWSSKIGEIVYSGIGEEMNKVLESQKMSNKLNRGRRRISEGGMELESGDDTENEDEGRLKFADIIIVPIQRASRYRLLFQELSTKLPTTSHTSLKIQRALEASTRLAIECDKCQSFDLGALRRQGKKSKRIRPVSVGPSVRA